MNQRRNVKDETLLNKILYLNCFYGFVKSYMLGHHTITRIYIAM